MKQLENNPSIKGDFINSDTTGLYKKVYKTYVDESTEKIEEHEVEELMNE